MADQIRLMIRGTGYMGAAGRTNRVIYGSEKGEESHAVWYRIGGVGAILAKAHITSRFGDYMGKAYLNSADLAYVKALDGIAWTKQDVEHAGHGTYSLWKIE